MVFTDKTETNQSDQAEQAKDQAQTQESFLDKLVQAKGDNWRNPEVLAKGKLEADGYIKTLEEQLAQMREELDKKEYMSKVMSQAEGKAPELTAGNSQSARDNGSTNQENTTPKISEDDLKSLVEQTLSKREQEAVLKNNLAIVDEELTKTYGTDAAAIVAEKAKGLGMSMERLKAIAEESPNAFFTLIGEKPRQVNPIVNGSVRTEGANMSGSSERDFNYYQKVRRENRSLYFSPKFQQQMMTDAARLGTKFYNS
jgi:hypothetical protein